MMLTANMLADGGGGSKLKESPSPLLRSNQ